MGVEAYLEEIQNLKDTIASLEMILHDLRRDSDAYRRGWREACEHLLGGTIGPADAVRALIDDAGDVDRYAP